MKHVINREDLEPSGSTSYVFEGYRYVEPSSRYPMPALERLYLIYGQRRPAALKQ